MAFDLGPEPDPKKDKEKDNREIAQMLRNSRAGRPLAHPAGAKEEDEDKKK